MKIDIIGAIGSGKTNLSRRIAEEFHIPCYEQDNIVWMRTRDGDVRRSDNEREKMFMDILTSKNWVIEGSPRKCLKKRYEYCDYIIFLDTNSFIRLYRILRRWIRQRTGKESYNTNPTLKFLWMNIKWHHEFNNDRKQLISELLQCGLRYKKFKSGYFAVTIFIILKVYRIV
ncbi:DNA topology modulation protein FlaR [Clostridium estertheticum]|uniref:DNA topology modulation protein FlaR n=1 Tax=Clostridium estertheticum TaxID=238834 RepID=UPI001CF1BF8D|nr:DNA topology modulation protein FlaR [Clostridium estertheticum]MCB2358751.1 DNA topology modulation protein FlaR [Clostridium estertheticum]